jgi:hypothetical protein
MFVFKEKAKHGYAKDVPLASLGYEMNPLCLHDKTSLKVVGKPY